MIVLKHALAVIASTKMIMRVSKEAVRLRVRIGAAQEPSDAEAGLPALPGILRGLHGSGCSRQSVSLEVKGFVMRTSHGVSIFQLFCSFNLSVRARM